MTTWKDYLENNYFKPGVSGAFAGPKKLYNILKQNKHHVTLTKVKQWLQDQDAFSLLQPVKYKFKRQRVITRGIVHPGCDSTSVSIVKRNTLELCKVTHADPRLE